MKPASLIIRNILIQYGLSETEADHLLARYLEEEAELYLECVSLFKEEA